MCAGLPKLFYENFGTTKVKLCRDHIYQIMTKRRVKKDPATNAVIRAGRKDLVIVSKLGRS